MAYSGGQVTQLRPGGFPQAKPAGSFAGKTESVGGGPNPNASASPQRDVQTIMNRAFDETNNILNTTTV